MQTVDGAEIERFRMIVVACGSIGNADFHFANGIDRHGRPPVSEIHKPEKVFSVETYSANAFFTAKDATSEKLGNSSGFRCGLCVFCG
jgi:hypothetical protein